MTIRSRPPSQEYRDHWDEIFKRREFPDKARCPWNETKQCSDWPEGCDHCAEAKHGNQV